MTKIDCYAQCLRWWELLTEAERRILINLVYHLDLSEYVKMNRDGYILGLKEVK